MFLSVFMDPSCKDADLFGSLPFLVHMCSRLDGVAWRLHGGVNPILT